MQRVLSSVLLTGLLWPLSLSAAPEKTAGPAAAQSQPAPPQAIDYRFYQRWMAPASQAQSPSAAASACLHPGGGQAAAQPTGFFANSPQAHR